MFSFAYDVERLLVALRAIRQERWASLHFYSVRGYVYTDKGRQIWPPSAMSDSSQLWPRSSAAAGNRGASHFLANTDTQQREGADRSPPPQQHAIPITPATGTESHCILLTFNNTEYITWASQILLVSLFSLENFPSFTSCSMYPLFLATLLTLKLLDKEPPFTYTFTQHVRTLGSTAAVEAKE